MYYYIYHFLSYTYIMSSFMLWLHAHAILFIYLSLFSTFCTLLVHILFVYYTLYFLYTVFMYCSFPILFSCYTFHRIVIYCAFHLILSYTILSYDIHILYFSYAFHILYLSYTFRVIDTLFLVLVYLSYTFLFHILYCSYTIFIYCTFHILLSCTIHILHIHLYVLILSIIYFMLSYTFCALEVTVGTTEINQIQEYP